MSTQHTSSYRTAAANVLDGIGDTPLVPVEGVWAKLEYMNPSGSIKARIARYMIERAEREGFLEPGDTIVEASSGNTGNALGPSSGANLMAARRIREAHPELKTIATIFCDEGEKYISEHFAEAGPIDGKT
jgi:cysteine synthase A